MKKIFTTMIAFGVLIQLSNCQIFRQVDPTVFTFNAPWKGLFFDETSYQSCFNDPINLASYYDPNEPNTQQMEEVLDVSIYTDADFGATPYAENCAFSGVHYNCQMVKSLQDIFCETFPEIQKNTILYIVFHYTTYVPCKNTITLTPPYENLLAIKRTFYPFPKVGELYFVNPSITTKTVEFNTDPGAIDNIPATGGDGTFGYQWMTLPDATSSGTLNISGATDQNYDPGKMTISTRYQRMDSPDVCGVPTKTNIVSITVLPDINPGLIGTSQIICYGNSVTIQNLQSASGGTGTYNYQWQSSQDGTTFQDIPNQIGLELTTSNLTQWTYFQRKCTSGVNAALSNIVAISVRDSLSAGIITPPQTICNNTIPAQIIGSDPTGGDGTYTYNWEFSTNKINWTPILGSNSKNYQPGSLTISTYFHRIVISGSNCGSKTSSPILITTYNPVDPGFITNSQMICYGAIPSPISGTGASGADGNYTYSWWYSFNGKDWNQLPGTNNLTYQPEALTNNTFYKFAVSTICGTFFTDSIAIEVKANVNPGTVGNPQTICYNSVPAVLTGTNAVGGFNTFSYQWQSSIDNLNWNDISGAIGQSLTSPALVKTSYFRRTVTDISCGTYNSNSVLINVFNQVPKPSVTVKPFYCFDNKVSLSAGNGTPYTYYWYDYSGNLLFSGNNYSISSIAQSQIITVKSKDSNGCNSDTLNIPLNVDHVIADFTTSTDSIKTGESVNFLNHSIDASSYLWDFSEGDQSTAENPWHYFNLPGKKTIRLISYSDNQCSDTLTKKNLITVSSPNSVNYLLSDSLTVFPNPMEDQIWIKGNNNKHIFVQFYTLDGKLLSQLQGFQELILDVKKYPAGIYILNIQVDQKLKIFKMIKN